MEAKDLVPRPAQAKIFIERSDLRDAARDYAVAADAANTIRARRADWKIFSRWCEVNGVQAMPADPETAAAFLTEQSCGTKERAPRAVATVMRYVQTIATTHKAAGFDPPPTDHEIVRRILRGIRRERGVRQKRRAPMDAAVVASVLPTYAIVNKVREARDRAVVLLGLATGMRQSELCALDLENVVRVEEGLIVDRRRSKIDQEGEGQAIAVPTLGDSPEFCAVRALEAWLVHRGIAPGPLFRSVRRNGRVSAGRLSADTVRGVVQRVAVSGGLDGTKFGGHSLRAGYVTTARKQGIDWGTIMEQTGHKRLETVKIYSRFTPDVFVATRVADVFRGAFKIK